MHFITEPKLKPILVLFLFTSSTYATPRIAGGKIVKDRTKFSYQASLWYEGNNYCGGIIINRTTILTAAHCTFYQNNTRISTNKLMVAVGHLKLNGRSTIFPVAKTTVHTNYNKKRQYENDIALWKIIGEFTFNDKINKVNLTKKRPTKNTNCIVSGWGITSEGANSSVNLRSVTVPIVSHKLCQLKTQICAGLGRKDACKGDSGGPLVCNGEVAGIVSLGFECRETKNPGV